MGKLRICRVRAGKKVFRLHVFFINDFFHINSSANLAKNYYGILPFQRGQVGQVAEAKRSDKARQRSYTCPAVNPNRTAKARATGTVARGELWNT